MYILRHCSFSVRTVQVTIWLLINLLDQLRKTSANTTSQEFPRDTTNQLVFRKELSSNVTKHYQPLQLNQVTWTNRTKVSDINQLILIPIICLIFLIVFIFMYCIFLLVGKQPADGKRLIKPKTRIPTEKICKSVYCSPESAHLENPKSNEANKIKHFSEKTLNTNSLYNFKKIDNLNDSNVECDQYTPIEILFKKQSKH